MTTTDNDQDNAENTADEKVIPPAVRQRLQECYQRACELMGKDKYDHDYANTMLSECVVADPANVIYIDAFLSNLQRKYNNNRKGARLQMFSGKSAIKKAVASGQWGEVLRLAPEVLKINPWDVTTLRGLASACEFFAYKDAEFRYFKAALKGSPQDADLNRHCAKSLARIGQFDRAIARWHKVEELNPTDTEAKEMISQLAMEKNRERAGYADEEEKERLEKYRKKHGREAPGAKRDGPPPLTPFLPEGGDNQFVHKEIKLTPRQKLEQAIADNPTELDHYFNLAELLSHQEKYGEAERTLNKALNVSPGDVEVHERLEALELRRARGQLAVAEMRAAKNGTESARDLVADLQEHLNRIEMDFYYSRCDRYPDDHGAKYEMGLRLRRAGNYSEAVKYLEGACDEPQQKAAALILMGECQQSLKRYSDGLLNYRNAVENAREQDQVDCLLLALYRAAVLASGLKDTGLAKKYLTEILDLDANYKDSQARLDKIT